MRTVIDEPTAAFINQSIAFRRVVTPLLLNAETGGAFDLDPAQLEMAGMREAQRAGILDQRFGPEALGRQVYLSYLGAMRSGPAAT